MIHILSISVFGVLGVLSRHFLNQWMNASLQQPFPYGIFLVNLLGAFAVGVVYVLGSEFNLFSPNLQIGFLVGFLGGFTTFSAYCLDTIRLIENQNYSQAFLYWLLSPALGVAFALGGIVLTRLFLK